ncbi:AzlD family protein [Marinospirillum sp.]|uniref:AzlD family protein n=1 Tax=Marinospirillum sp. TaxID=2183934 RepID=UPI003A8AAB51
MVSLPSLTQSLMAIGLMAGVTLVTRFGGLWIMHWVPLHPRVEGFIQGMSGSVLIALILPMAIEGDTAARLALLLTAAVMLLWRRPLLAIAAGLLLTASWRAVVGLP